MSLLLDASAQDLLFRQARTINTFTDEPVSEEQIQGIYDLVKYAPTSLNTQPLRIVLVRSPQARERLLSHMGEGNKPKTAAAPGENVWFSRSPRLGYDDVVSTV